MPGVDENLIRRRRAPAGDLGPELLARTEDGVRSTPLLECSGHVMWYCLRTTRHVRIAGCARSSSLLCEKRVRHHGSRNWSTVGPYEIMGVFPRRGGCGAQGLRKSGRVRRASVETMNKPRQLQTPSAPAGVPREPGVAYSQFRLPSHPPTRFSPLRPAPTAPSKSAGMDKQQQRHGKERLV